MKEEKRFSNKAGEEYDLFSLALPHQDDIQKDTVSLLINNFNSNIKNIKVLEIGFGTGITSKELLLRDKRITLFAVDNEGKMFDKAFGKLKVFPKNRFTLQTIDVLDFLKTQKDNSFDAVVSVWVLHNLNKNIRNNILKEIFRVLKKGGIFVNGDKYAVQDKELHKNHLDWQIKQFDIFDKIKRPELKKEWIKHYTEDENSTRILFEKEFLLNSKKIGFSKAVILGRRYLDAIGFVIK